MITIALAITRLVQHWYYNQPLPNLEVEWYDYVPGWISEGRFVNGNYVIEHSYGIANLTLMVYNSGKGTARNVTLSMLGEPPDLCQVIKADVFLGEPLQSNFYKSVGNEHRIRFFETGETVSIVFHLKYELNVERLQTFILNVASENAREIVYVVQIQPEKS